MAKEGLTDSKLARAVGVSPSTIGRYLSGERDPDFEMLDKLAKALRTTVPALVAGPEELGEMEADYALRILEAALKGKPRPAKDS